MQINNLKRHMLADQDRPGVGAIGKHLLQIMFCVAQLTSIRLRMALVMVVKG